MSIEIPGESQQETAHEVIQVLVTLDPATGKIGMQTNLQANPMNSLVIQGLLDNAKGVAKQMAQPHQQNNIALPPVAMNGRRF